MGRARRIRVPGVPADFCFPRGWPTPTDRWVRDNALWSPPPGWTPLPGVSPAPPDWNYWVPNRLWPRIAAPHYRSIVILARVGNWLTPLWIVGMLAGPLLGYPPAVRVVALVALLGAFACYVTYEILRTRISRRLLTECAVLADRGRRERLVKEYQHYLMAVA